MAGREIRYGNPVYGRPKSSTSSSDGSRPPPSPRHVRSSSAGDVRSSSAGVPSVKKNLSYAAKAAATRLAQFMASQSTDDDDGEDNLHELDRSNTSTCSKSSGSQYSFKLHSTSTGHSSVALRPAPVAVMAASVAHSRTSSLPTSTAWLTEALESMNHTSRETRASADMERLTMLQDSENPQREAAALNDEIDLLQEENEVILNKLRLAEEKLQKSTARANELEKQVASLGEGISLDVRLLSRKEAALQQREAALQAEKETKDEKDEEIAALRLDAEASKEESITAIKQFRNAESESKALRSMTHRMILTQDEMEEVVLKRCWLARYWGLAVHFGIHEEISASKHEHWSSLAPLPLEVVLSAGQKARDHPFNERNNSASFESRESRKRLRNARDVNDITAEGNIESMLSVEKGLRELTSLKVEDAVMFAMAECRRSSSHSQGFSELNSEEIEDVQFKQAWLMYYWRLAKNNGIQDGIAHERLQYWSKSSTRTPTFEDAIDVEKGMKEIRKLGLEDQLWETSRMDIFQEGTNQLC